MTATIPTHEREITAPCALVDRRGRLDPRAIGWARRPLHDARLTGFRGRKKRWQFWAVMSESHMLALTLADVDYLGLATATLVDLASGAIVERVAATPSALGLRLPDAAEGGAIRFDALGLHIGMVDDVGGLTRLTARFAGRASLDADVTVRRPPGHETMNVVIPWSERRFQLTSKQTALPAEGVVRVNGREVRFGDGAFACLDYGRGVWPYRTAWNWAAGAGTCDGKSLGINLGGRWTRGTGMTENAITIDGRLHKLGGEMTFDFDPRDLDRLWRIHGDRVDLVLTPRRTRRVRVDAWVLGSRLDHAIGTFDGTIVADDGARIAVRGLRGWAEDHRARW
jgi:hypothetical protein